MKRQHPHNLRQKLWVAHLTIRFPLANLFLPLLILLLFQPTPCSWATLDDLDLVLQFDSDSAKLTAKARQKLSAYMAGVALGNRGKVLVVGHADDKGERRHNRALSRKRAAVVRNFLIEELKTPAERVLAMGQGKDAPIAANDTAKGRARNRRVVVRLVGSAPPEIQRRYGGQDPRLVAVDQLLTEADANLHQGHIKAALADLDRAAELGGDQYSRWHTSYGIAGYLGGQPAHKLKGYFEMALALDPHNSDARHFLGRIEAREAFLEGRVVPYMGRTPRSAIKVTSHSQEYEYLKLFDVEPLTHHTLAQGTIDVWTCQAGQDRIVTYYFDTTSVLEWAYAGETVHP